MLKTSADYPHRIVLKRDEVTWEECEALLARKNVDYLPIRIFSDIIELGVRTQDDATRQLSFFALRSCDEITYLWRHADPRQNVSRELGDPNETPE